MVDLETRCNYFATIQSLIINKVLIDVLYLFRTDVNSKILFGVWLVIVLFSGIMTAVDDVVYFSILSTRISVHNDLFDYGIIAGKLFEAVSSIFFNGIIFYHNYFQAIIDLIK